MQISIHTYTMINVSASFMAVLGNKENIHKQISCESVTIKESVTTRKSKSYLDPLQ